MERLRVGIVGCGLVTKLRHIPAYRKLRGHVELRAVCDINEKLANEVAEYAKGIEVYSSVRDMLSNEDLNVVDICVPPNEHAPIALEAMERGCHVLIEKPMALTTPDCDKMIAMADAKNVKLCTIHSDLFHPPFIKAKELVRGGEIGEFTGMRIFLSTPRFDMIDIENHWCHKLPGGVISETGPHMAYMSLAFLKGIRNVDVYARSYLKHPWAANDYFTIVLEGENGISSTTLAYSEKYWAASVDVFGTDAYLNLDLESMAVRKYALSRLSYPAIAGSSMRGIGQQIASLTSNAFKGITGNLRTGTDLIIREFISSISSHSNPPVTPEEGREVVRVMEMVVEKYKGRLVSSEQ